MLFSSISFIYIYLPLCIFVYYILPKQCKNLFLLLFSLFFYAYDKPSFLPIMLGCIGLTYINGILLEKYRNKIHFVCAIIMSLFPLLYFKYTNFFLGNINALFGSNFHIENLLLPLGISFYTFQMLSYIIDVYRKKVMCEKNFLDLALYVTFFPQLIAGPIVKFIDIKDQIKNRKHSFDLFGQGVFYFVIGLSKKVLLANQLGEFCSAYHLLDEKNIAISWAYAFAYFLQVYFDFSGYSTMAIGLGKMFGFELPMNFNYPLLAESIQDFWKRWHMTLSGFFKEYLYIPLGGSRCKPWKHILNLFIVWFATGLWHGANWNFVLWGLYFFVLLVIEKYIVKDRVILSALKTTLTVPLILISFVLFGATDISNAFETIKSLFTWGTLTEDSSFLMQNYGGVFFISLFFAFPIVSMLYNDFKNTKVAKIMEPIVLGFLLLLCTAYLVDGSFNPFLYFRF